MIHRYECDCEACPRDMSGLHNSWNADLALEIDRRYKTGLERIMERLQTPEEKKAEPVALYAEMTTEVLIHYWSCCDSVFTAAFCLLSATGTLELIQGAQLVLQRQILRRKMKVSIGIGS